MFGPLYGSLGPLTVYQTASDPVLELEDGSGGFALEDGSGTIILEGEE